MFGPAIDEPDPHQAGDLYGDVELAGHRFQVGEVARQRLQRGDIAKTQGGHGNEAVIHRFLHRLAPVPAPQVGNGAGEKMLHQQVGKGPGDGQEDINAYRADDPVEVGGTLEKDLPTGEDDRQRKKRQQHHQLQYRQPVMIEQEFQGDDGNQ